VFSFLSCFPVKFFVFPLVPKVGNISRQSPLPPSAKSGASPHCHLLTTSKCAFALY
jgi:hypothetical protein